MAGHTVIVSVLADTKKFSRAFKNLSNEVGLTKLGNGFKTVGSKIGGMAKTAVKATAAITAGIAALAIKGGFERAMKIEDAQAKLKGLGHDAAAVDQIMADALASVKGTAYGLDTAATTAATAVAAGIEPGQQLEKYLKLTADAATIAGVSMDEMGGIMNKVAAKGKVSAREINQFTERGIPILQMLADEYQVTTEEMSKMVSAGEVDAERFREALEKGVGGAALESGNTTRGAFENMKAALSRVGVALIEDVFPMFKDLFNGITSGLDNLTDAVKPVGEAFGHWLEERAIPAVKALGGWIRDDLWPVLKNVGETLQGAFATAVDTITGALERAGFSASDTGEAIGGTLLTVLGKAAEAVAWVVEKLAEFAAWVIEHRDTIAGIAVVIAGAVAAFSALQKVLTIVKAAMVVFNVVMAANPIVLVIAAVAALVGALVWFFTQTETGQQIFTTAWEKIKEIATSVADWFTEHVGPVFEAFGELWNAVWSEVQAVWDVIGDDVIQAVMNGFETMGTVVSGIWNGIKIVIETVLGVIQGIIQTVTALIKGDWEGAWQGIQQIGQTIWDGIGRLIDNAINAVWNTIKNIVGQVVSFWGEKWNSVKTTALNIFENIKTGAREKFDAMVDFIRNIPDNIKSIFSNAGNWLLSAGKNIISGLWDGLKSKWESVKGWFGGLGGWITENKGPKAYDLALLVPAGKWIMQGLQTGLQKEIPNLKRTLTGVADTVVATPFEPLQASLDARQVRVESGVGNQPQRPVVATFTEEQINLLRDVFREAAFAGTSGGVQEGFGVTASRQLMYSRGGG